ncbi:IQ domain-containing protein H-like [Oscarella lobularis]|uniref:IQ domain-containing protein H-like n=1 Tax=Oscarella lobularis TaxID=121494 RepID=UPI003313F33C
MSATSEAGDVGNILAKVQDELHRLKEQFATTSDSETTVLDLRHLENAIERTERGIKAHAEKAFHAANNQVLTLPLVSNNSPVLQREPILGSLSKSPAKLASLKAITSGSSTVGSPSPGQKVKEAWGGRLIRNPTNAVSRQFLSQRFGVSLPAVAVREKQVQESKKIVSGTTVEPLTVLPRQNRIDPQLTPPPITEDDARKGLRSLIERGLIPPAAELSLKPSPVKNRQARLHSHSAQFSRLKISDGTAAGSNLAGVKVDPDQAFSSPKPVEKKSSTKSVSASPPPLPPSQNRHSSTLSCSTALSAKATARLTPVTFETQLPQLPAPYPTPATTSIDAQKIVIQQGFVVTTSAEYEAFQQANAIQWGSIVSIIKQLEVLLKAFSIPIAVIDCEKLSALSLHYELEHRPSREELMNCIINQKDVRRLMNVPGQRFKAANGHHVAATCIQTQYRRYRDRIKYLAYRKQKWAAGVIAMTWLLHIRIRRVRERLQNRRALQLERFAERRKALKNDWASISKSRRVIIHIPSKGYPEDIRETLKDFPISQNYQMARISDIRDPLVEVIYISPVTLSDETLQYYIKLMRMCSESGKSEIGDDASSATAADIGDRFHVIVPERLNTFTGHNMALSTILMYSLKTIERIKNLIKGRPAFIVPGIVSRDDVAVADMLGVPCLSAEPDVARLYSTKSGGRIIFADAKMGVPPSELGIYGEQQVFTSLASLVTNNLHVQRWIFKVDDEFDSRGMAYCDVTKYLQCYDWAVKESQRYGEKWTKKWAQEAANGRIAAELPSILRNHVVILNKRAYPTWEKFLAAFVRGDECRGGGVIEAAPPSHSVTSLTVDFFIDPCRNIRLMSSGDQVHDSPYHLCAMSVPQASVDPQQLKSITMAVAKSCCNRGIIGYVCVDFVTFIDPLTMNQQVWAVDLDVQYSDSLAMCQLFRFVTGGDFDFSASGLFEVPIDNQLRLYEEKEEERRKRRREWEDDVILRKRPTAARFGVMSARLYHTNLSVIRYSVFFQMCRAHTIGFDMEERCGCVFTLVDSSTRSRIGMICIGEDLPSAIALFSRNLSIIHQEISAPTMPGINNFKATALELHKIAGITEENETSFAKQE